MTTKFKGGVMPASMSMWKDDGSFDAKRQEQYISWLLDKGVDALSCTGSTGENQAMSWDEQKQIIEVVVKTAAGQVPVYAGTGFYDTGRTVEMSKYAADMGCSGVMVLLPHYFTPHKRAVYDHYRTLRKALPDDVDIMVYNNPWFANYELSAKEIKMLVDEGVVGSVKAAHGEVDRVHNLKWECGDDLTVYYGHDYNGLEAYCAGADGWLSGIPAVFPAYCKAIQTAIRDEKDLEKGNEIAKVIKEYMDYFLTYKTGDPHWLEIFKYTLQAQGVDAGLPKKPLGELDAENKAIIDKAVAAVGEYL